MTEINLFDTRTGSHKTCDANEIGDRDSNEGGLVVEVCFSACRGISVEAKAKDGNCG